MKQIPDTRDATDGKNIIRDIRKIIILLHEQEDNAIRNVVVSGLKNEWMAEQKKIGKGEKCAHLAGRGKDDEDGIGRF